MASDKDVEGGSVLIVGLHVVDDCGWCTNHRDGKFILLNISCHLILHQSVYRN